MLSGHGGKVAKQTEPSRLSGAPALYARSHLYQRLVRGCERLYRHFGRRCRVQEINSSSPCSRVLSSNGRPNGPSYSVCPDSSSCSFHLKWPKCPCIADFCPTSPVGMGTLITCPLAGWLDLLLLVALEPSSCFCSDCDAFGRAVLSRLSTLARATCSTFHSILLP